MGPTRQQNSVRDEWLALLRQPAIARLVRQMGREDRAAWEVLDVLAGPPHHLTFPLTEDTFKVQVRAALGVVLHNRRQNGRAHLNTTGLSTGRLRPSKSTSKPTTTETP